jgi:hypothetical protein
MRQSTLMQDESHSVLYKLGNLRWVTKGKFRSWPQSQDGRPEKDLKPEQPTKSGQQGKTQAS